VAIFSCLIMIIYKLITKLRVGSSKESCKG
jgi:hypothetical protein